MRNLVQGVKWARKSPRGFLDFILVRRALINETKMAMMAAFSEWARWGKEYVEATDPRVTPQNLMILEVSFVHFVMNCMVRREMAAYENVLIMQHRSRESLVAHECCIDENRAVLDFFGFDVAFLEENFTPV